jgi:3-phosphoshikimate 1-carboxyvinyltransferase
MICTLTSRGRVIKGKVQLPFSKSESNRLLIIRELCSEAFVINNLSEADDTRLLRQLLQTTETTIDCGPAGTTFRFLTALLACRPGRSAVLTGSERMKERPIGILTEALVNLGADIVYLEKTGFPPVQINGRVLEGGKVAVEGNVSSQFISALLLIAPTLKNGLKIDVKGQLVSAPYVKMTLQIMHHFGINYEWKGNSIAIASQAYRAADCSVARDWSAASYWYELAALSEEADILLEGLHKGTVQGDEIVADWFAELGVETVETAQGIRLIKQPEGKPRIRRLVRDFTACPDLAPAFAVTCAALGIEAKLSGIEHLKIKETDRVKALCNELEKLGVKSIYRKGELELKDKITKPIDQNYVLYTYHDHRMAMAFAPLAVQLGVVNVAEPAVVDKSYPGYWKELGNFFLIHQKP